MDGRTRNFLLDLLRGDDPERVARWMARTLRVGSLPDCRALLTEAQRTVKSDA